MFFTVSRESLVLLLGFVVFFTPVLGIPTDWKQHILTVSGVLLIVVGFLLRRSAYFRKIDRGNGERGNDSFEESDPKKSVVNEENDTV